MSDLNRPCGVAPSHAGRRSPLRGVRGAGVGGAAASAVRLRSGRKELGRRAGAMLQAPGGAAARGGCGGCMHPPTHTLSPPPADSPCRAAPRRAVRAALRCVQVGQEGADKQILAQEQRNKVWLPLARSPCWLAQTAAVLLRNEMHAGTHALHAITLRPAGSVAHAPPAPSAAADPPWLHGPALHCSRQIPPPRREAAGWLARPAAHCTCVQSPRLPPPSPTPPNHTRVHAPCDSPAHTPPPPLPSHPRWSPSCTRSSSPSCCAA